MYRQRSTEARFRRVIGVRSLAILGTTMAAGLVVLLYGSRLFMEGRVTEPVGTQRQEASAIHGVMSRPDTNDIEQRRIQTIQQPSPSESPDESRSETESSARGHAPRGFRSPEFFPPAAVIAKDLSYNPQRMDLSDSRLAMLDEYIADTNALLSNLEKKKVALAEQWALRRIELGDFRFGVYRERATSSPGQIAVTVSRKGVELPMIVDIGLGENALLDLASDELEWVIANARTQIRSTFR